MPSDRQNDVRLHVKLEHQFITEGWIKERMHAARTGYRKDQDARLEALILENQELKKRIAELEKSLKKSQES